MAGEWCSLKDEKEILALTGLRFVAAFYVFLFHIHIRWPLADAGLLSNVLNQGAIGMSIFFLLSGFVLAYRYRDGRTGTRDYLLNRFARIYPIYAIAALVTVPWFGVSLGDGSLSSVTRVPQFFSMWNVGGSWSISVEAFCYVLLPVVLPALVRLTWTQQKVVAVICVVLASMPGLSAKLFETPSAGVFYFMPIFRLPEFVLGCIVCLAWADRRIRPTSSLVQVVAVSAFVAYLGFAGPSLPIYVGHNWIALPVIAGATLCLAYGTGSRRFPVVPEHAGDCRPYSRPPPSCHPPLHSLSPPQSSCPTTRCSRPSTRETSPGEIGFQSIGGP